LASWYNGYRIGSCTGIYNPWSVLSCIADKGALAPYWVNTSDNALMKKLIRLSSGTVKEEIEVLIRGGVVKKKIDEGLAFAALDSHADALWVLLLFSGYLTLDQPPPPNPARTPCLLRIPNLEINNLCPLTHSIFLYN